MSASIILLVEDSPTQAIEIAANLRRHGVEVVHALDGVEALNMVDKYRPVLIVLDVNLPKMDGFQVCRRLKRDPATQNIPIVMLTVADSSEATLQGLEAGADDYIPKDVFAHETLISTLEAFNIKVRQGEG